MEEYSAYVGLDVHKDSIAVAVAYRGRSEPKYLGEIPNTKKAILRLVHRLSPTGELLAYCYEAGPCGYGVYHTIREGGHDCEVVAPTKVPRKAGERVKTDRRDAVKLARSFRSGELTAVWVPDREQEAIRDLTRAREDMKQLERMVRQRLNGFLLRRGKVYPGKSKWTQKHARWLAEVEMESAVQQIVLVEYVDAVKRAQEQVAGLEEEMRKVLPEWSLAGGVEALMALRGVNLVTAMTVMAELGDISRFDSPRQLMAYLGLVPSEHSSGGRHRRGGITKTGNARVRSLLVESAWCYRFPARKSAHLQKKAEKLSREVQAIAWKAQKRLCPRYQALIRAGKVRGQVTTAIARELSGFMWAIACEVMNKAQQRAA